MKTHKRIRWIVSIGTALLVVAGAATWWPHAESTAPPSRADIQISFKLDARLSGPTYGGERWVSPPTYMGVSAQDSVEARAQALDEAGQPTKVVPTWTASDPAMVTMSPSGGNVTIAVRHAGESKLKLSAPGVSKELVVKATGEGKALQIEITQAAAVRARPAQAARKVKTQRPKASKLATQKEKLSYALGMNLGNGIHKEELDVDDDLILNGLDDALANGTMLLSEQEARDVLLATKNELAGKQAAHEHEEHAKLAEKNKREGDTFLAANQKKPGVVTLPSGLQYKVLKTGTGKKPTDFDLVECKYRGTRIDGTEFDSSERRGRAASFLLGGAMPGWREALKLVPVGSQVELVVPPGLSYAAPALRNMRGIGENATLVFNIELLGVKAAPAAAKMSPAARGR